MEALWAEQALTGEGWRRGVRVEIAGDGRIAAIEPESPAQGRRVGILLPAPANLHSHAFQRAMAGLTEQRGPDPRDSFWTWRRLMYRFLERIGPDELESIAAFAQMQMLEAASPRWRSFTTSIIRREARPTTISRSSRTASPPRRRRRGSA